MREDREAARVLDALEAFLAGVDTTRLVRQAFLLGVRVGRRSTLSTLSTGHGVTRTRVPIVGFAPLRPPTPTSYIQDPLDPDPDLRSRARANSGAAGTLELFAAPAPPRRADRATSWPDDFTLTEERRAIAVALDLDPVWEWNSFKDHHRAKGSRFVRWSDAWRTWCRRSWEYARRRGAP